MIPIRPACGGSTHQLHHGALATRFPGSVGFEIRYTRQRYHGRDRYRIFARQHLPAGSPQGQMAASGMTNQINLADIYRISSGKRKQVIHTAGDVVKRTWPAPARITDPPVFQGPDGITRVGQGGAGGVGVSDVECVEPATTVNEYNDGKRAAPIGQPELSVLLRFLGVEQLRGRQACG